MKNNDKKMDGVSNGILYGLLLGTLIYVQTQDTVFFALIGPGAMLGLLFEISAGRVQSKYPIGILYGMVFGLLLGLILFLATGRALWLALVLPGAALGLFANPAARAKNLEQ